MSDNINETITGYQTVPVCAGGYHLPEALQNSNVCPEVTAVSAAPLPDLYCDVVNTGSNLSDVCSDDTTPCITSIRMDSRELATTVIEHTESISLIQSSISGSLNVIPKFSHDGYITESNITDDGTIITINADIVPSLPNTFSLGTSAYPFKDLYLGVSTLYVGNSSISQQEDGSISIGDINVDELQTQILEISGSYSTIVYVDSVNDNLQSQITINSNNISSNTSDISTLQSQVISISANNSDDVSLTLLSGISGNLQSQITTNTDDISTLQSQVIQISGGLWSRTAAISGNSSNEDVIGVTDTSVARTITLSTSDVINGNHLIIKDESGGAGTNNITIDTEGTEKIDGQDTAVIGSNYDSISLYSDGSNWFIF